MTSSAGEKLPQVFYDRPTLTVAPDLLGKYIVYESAAGRLSARVVEVEAYVGQEDPACHASRGLTPRTRPMFGPPGRSYIYLVYGMYHCLNFVTESERFPAAVLLRAAEPERGLERMRQLSSGQDDLALLSGPGKFCRSFGLSTEQNDLDLTEGKLYLEDRREGPVNVATSGRIGIKVGIKREWRFFDADSRSVSKGRPL